MVDIIKAERRGWGLKLGRQGATGCLKVMAAVEPCAETWAQFLSLLYPSSPSHHSLSLLPVHPFVFKVFIFSSLVLFYTRLSILCTDRLPPPPPSPLPPSLPPSISLHQLQRAVSLWPTSGASASWGGITPPPPPPSAGVCSCCSLLWSELRPQASNRQTKPINKQVNLDHRFICSGVQSIYEITLHCSR